MKMGLGFAGEEREDGGQNHCAPTTGLTFRKGNIITQIKINSKFMIMNDMK